MDPKNRNKQIDEANKERASQEREIDDKVRLFQRAYDSFPDEASKKMLSGGPEGQVRQLLDKNNFKNLDEIIEARGYWSNYKDTPAEKKIPSEKTEETVSVTSKSPPGTTATMLAAVGAGAAYDRFIKDRGYKKFKEKADKYAKEKVEEWKNNPNPEYARSEKGAYNHAYNDYHDDFLTKNSKNATKWAKKHNDEALKKAIKKKEILDKPNPKRDWRETERFMDKGGIKHPEKTHKTERDISREESNKRIASAAAIGATQVATPIARQEQASRVLEAAKEEGAKQNATSEAAADSLQETADQLDENAGQSEFEKRINAANQNAEPSDFEKRMLAAKEKGEGAKTLSPEDAVKNLEEQIEIEKQKQDDDKGLVLPKEPKSSTSQPVMRRRIPTASYSTPRQRRTLIGRTTYPFRRGARARRRYGGIGGRMGRSAATKGVKRGAVRAGSLVFTNPWVLAAIGIILVILLLLFAVIVVIQDTCDKFSDPVRFVQESIADPGGMALRAPIWGLLVYTNMCPNAPYEADVPSLPAGVTLTKSGPFTADNGDSITYKILFEYNPYADGAISITELQEMSIFDVPMFNYTLNSTVGTVTPKSDPEAEDYIEFELSNNEDCLNRNVCEFEITLTPAGSDFFAVNIAYVGDEYEPIEFSFNADLTGAADPSISGDLTEGRNAIPSMRRCYVDGKPQWNVSNHPNFGDPVCSYTPEKFSAYLREIAPAKDVVFYEDISRTEGSDPRIGGNINKGSASGWGTFQMGPYTDTIDNHGPGNWKFRFPWNHGDVPWQRQIEFAVARNNYWEQKYDGNFMYWGTAYCLCYFDFYRDKNGWCDDIRDQNRVRCPYSCFGGTSYCSTRTDAVGRERNGAIDCSAHACYTGIGDSRVNRNTSKDW